MPYFPLQLVCESRTDTCRSCTNKEPLAKLICSVIDQTISTWSRDKMQPRVVCRRISRRPRSTWESTSWNYSEHPFGRCGFSLNNEIKSARVISFFPGTATWNMEFISIYNGIGNCCHVDFFNINIRLSWNDVMLKLLKMKRKYYKKWRHSHLGLNCPKIVPKTSIFILLH